MLKYQIFRRHDDSLIAAFAVKEQALLYVYNNRDCYMLERKD